MSPRRSTLLLQAAGVAGLLLTIVGTFLPWLGSGTTTRTSYAAGGAVRRLIDPGRVVHDLLGVWPLLGIATAAALAALLLGRVAVALGLALLVAVIAGTGALAVLPIHGNRYAHVLITGPAFTLAGATLVALTGLIGLVLTLAGRPR